MTVITNDTVGTGSTVDTSGDNTDQTIVVNDAIGPLGGSQNADSVIAGDGNDKITTNSGNDDIVAGDGDDQVIAGGGSDDISGGAGNDKLRGQAGNDVMLGGDGNDKLLGGKGNDRLFGEGDNDRLYGGDGNDAINGGDGDDKLWGDSAGDGDDNEGYADVFFFDTSDGNDIVMDFEEGLDQILLLDGGSASFVTNFASDGSVKSTTMTYGSTTVTFRNVDVDADDVIAGTTIGDFYDAL
jgi:Ca2+-binding RTX toxin-like protein